MFDSNIFKKNGLRNNIQTLLYFLDRSLENIGGVERYSFNFIKFFKVIEKKGISVTLLTREVNRSTISKEIYARFFRSDAYQFHNAFRLFNPILRLWNLICRTRKFLVEQKPNIVVSRDFLPVITARIILGKKTKIIFVPGSLFTMDISIDQDKAIGGVCYKFSRKIQQLLGKSLEWLGMLCADYVTISSNFFRNNILQHYQIKSEKLVYLPVGINLHPFLGSQSNNKLIDLGITPNQKIILSVCRMVVSKNIYKILDVIPELPDDYVWLVIGDGPELIPFRQSVLDHGYKGRILVPGSKTNVAPFYASSQVFVHLSYYENFGQVLLEAMASGLPPVVLRPDHPGMKTATVEIVHDGRNGFWVENNPKAIAGGILKAAAAKGGPVAKRAIEHVTDKYSFETHLTNLVALIKGTYNE